MHTDFSVTYMHAHYLGYIAYNYTHLTKSRIYLIDRGFRLFGELHMQALGHIYLYEYMILLQITSSFACRVKIILWVHLDIIDISRIIEGLFLDQNIGIVPIFDCLFYKST